MTKLHIGTMGWSYEFWKGDFYPEGTKAEEFLSVYAKHFDTVEANSTFYRIPYKETVENWRDRTPEGFIFSAKFPRKITHIKKLQDCQEELDVFIEHLSLLGDKLGPLLLQFSPQFKPESINILEDFLPHLPEGYRYAIEVRNKKWLEERFYSLLREHGIALVLMDHPWMPDMDTITADFTYIRWEGDRKKVKGDLGKIERDMSRDIKEWSGKVKGFLDDSVEVYGYFSKNYSGYPPGDVQRLLEHF
jgi:uncharacterized protein YecE (DUF72 family)